MSTKPKLLESGWGDPSAHRSFRGRRRGAKLEHDDPRGLIWAVFSHGPYFVLVRYAQVSGVISPVSVEVRGFSASSDEKMTPVSTSALRFPLDGMTQAVRLRHRAELRELAAAPGIEHAPSRLEKPSQAGRPPDYDYDEVAAVYRRARIDGHPPTQAVARKYRLEPSAAAKLVGRVRKAGRLEPTTKGKPSPVSVTIRPPVVEAVATVPMPRVSASKKGMTR